MKELDRDIIKHIVKNALTEDIGSGDITTAACVPESKQAEAVIIAKEGGVIAGLVAARLVFEMVDPKIKFHALIDDGVEVGAGSHVAKLSGPARGILTAERVALNFLQRLSGIATLTSKFVKKTKKYPAKIMDTRKTTPGLRILEKYAVRAGGGENHRMGLYDAFLIKDNHIAVSGGRIDKAVKSCLEADEKKIVEVEVTTLLELETALEAGANIVLLDNMELKTLAKAVQTVKKWNKGKPEAKHVRIEASGGVNLKNVAEIAATGVDIISIGALTHSAPALDMSLEIQ